MIRTSVTAGVATALALYALAAAAADSRQADEAALRQTDGAWVKAAQTKQVDAWLAFYTADATVMPPNDKVAHGREAARKSVAELLGLPALEIRWQPSQVTVARSGELAYLAGAYVVHYQDHGQSVTDTGKFLEVWRKQSDGSWKCSADIWNSDLPSAGSTVP